LDFKRILCRSILSNIRLALNEERAPFTPTIWTKPPSSNTVLKQVWFPGTHTAVGGGGKPRDHELSNIALVWMIQQVRDHTNLAFDEDYLKTSKMIDVKLDRPWGCADYTPSGGAIWKMAGTVARTPNKDSPDSHEKLHRSVEERRNFNKRKSERWTHPHIRGMDYDDLGTLELEMKARYPS
jgi:hypothetical protein